MIRVIRVGGSLLTWDQLPSQLLRFLADQSPATNVLVAGGGEWVELLRQSAKRFLLAEQDAHWLSVRAMSLTAKLLSIATGIQLISDFHAIVYGEPTTFVLDAEVFLRTDEPRISGTPLPCSWEVTSDSIAARIAQALRADELVLLKSSDCQNANDFETLAETGFVDRFFPIATQGVKAVRFVNLRGDSVAG